MHIHASSFMKRYYFRFIPSFTLSGSKVNVIYLTHAFAEAVFFRCIWKMSRPLENIKYSGVYSQYVFTTTIPMLIDLCTHVIQWNRKKQSLSHIPRIITYGKDCAVRNENSKLTSVCIRTVIDHSI